MSITIENLGKIAGLTVMAIAETNVAPRRFGEGLFFAGTKAPAAIAFRKGRKIAAITLDGVALAPAEIEERFPGAVDRIASTRKRRQKKKR